MNVEVICPMSVKQMLAHVSREDLGMQRDVKGRDGVYMSPDLIANESVMHLPYRSQYSAACPRKPAGCEAWYLFRLILPCIYFCYSLPKSPGRRGEGLSDGGDPLALLLVLRFSTEYGVLHSRCDQILFSHRHDTQSFNENHGLSSSNSNGRDGRLSCMVASSLRRRFLACILTPLEIGVAGKHGDVLICEA